MKINFKKTFSLVIIISIIITASAFTANASRYCIDDSEVNYKESYDIGQYYMDGIPIENNGEMKIRTYCYPSCQITSATVVYHCYQCPIGFPTELSRPQTYEVTANGTTRIRAWWNQFAEDYDHSMKMEALNNKYDDGSFARITNVGNTWFENFIN